MKWAEFSQYYPEPENSPRYDRGIIEDVVRRSLEGARLTASETYEDAVEVLHSLWRCSGATHVIADGLKKYYPQTATAIDGAGGLAMIPVVSAWLQQLVRSLASTFTQPPSYQWVKRSTGEIVEGPEVALQNLYWSWAAQQCHLSQRLREAEEILTYARTVVLQPAWRRGSLSLDVLRPSLARIVQDADDPQSIAYAPLIALMAASTPTEYGFPTSIIQLWRYNDATGSYSYETRDTKGQTVPHNLFGGQTKNEYGIHPVVVWRDSDVDGTIYADIDESILSLALLVAATMSDGAYSARVGAGGILFRTMSDGTTDKTIARDALAIGPGVMWLGYEGETLTRIDGSANIPELIQYLEWILSSASNFYGLPWNVFQSQGDMSALAQRASQWLVDRRRIAEQAVRERQVAELYQTVARVWNYHRIDAQLRTDLDLKVVPWSPPVVEDRLHTSQALRMEYEDGTLSPIDTIMERQGISRDEATKIYNQNVELYRSSRGNVPVGRTEEYLNQEVQ